MTEKNNMSTVNNIKTTNHKNNIYALYCAKLEYIFWLLLATMTSNAIKWAIHNVSCSVC